MNDKKFSLPLLNEPSPYVRTLIDALLPLAELRRYKKGVRLPLLIDKVKMYHLVISGTVTAHRETDQLLIVTIPAPSILGLGIHDAYLLTTGACEIASLSLDDAMNHITEKGLWELVSRHMMILTGKFYTYSKQLSAPTVYEVICNQLVELMGEPESLRNSIAVERYIREKTHVSRSSVMKILADLKSGGYIVIEGGRLIEIHHLPPKY